MQHQGHRPRNAGRGHAGAAEGHVAVARVVLSGHHVRADEGDVGFHSILFCGSLAAVFRNGRVLVERPHRDHVLGSTRRSDGAGCCRVPSGDEHADARSNHFVGVSVHAVFLGRGPFDWARSTEAHGCGSDVEFVSVFNGPLHTGHDHRETSRAPGVKHFDADEVGLWSHTGVFVSGCAGSSNGPGAVRAVALVVVGLDFCAVGLVGVVDGVVKGDHLGVVCAVVVVQVVQPDVQTVDAGVDDGHGDARTVVPGLLLGEVHFMDDCGVAVLHLKNTVKFQHHHAR